MFKKIIFFVGLLAVLVIATSLVLSLSNAKRKTEMIKINGAEIKVEVAKTSAEYYQGLSGRDDLCQNCGMLFVFADKTERTFVMRGMLFPIDIIWIDGEKIVKIDKDLPPPVSNSGDGGEYKSGQPVNYVLEVKSGFCRENKVKIGDKAEYLK